MKVMNILLLTTVLTACVENKPLEKPFVIIDKNKWQESVAPYYYVYQDKNGQQVGFNLEIDRYNIGDTIK